MATLEQARALWWQRQGLAGGKGAVARVVGATGWLRTLAGVDAYIAARARVPGMTRAQLDAAVAAGELRVVPAVRGCIYLVPASVIPDVMALNAETWRAAATKDLAKIRKSLNDIEALAPAVLRAIGDAALTTDAIRKVVDVPSFGEAGKKIGLSSPLPLALRLLELDGRIARTLDGGRLDSDRYLWRAATPAKPTAAARAELLGTVVTAFLAYAGPATVDHVAAWSGAGVRELLPVLERVAEPVPVDGIAKTCWLRRGDRKALDRAPAPTGIALLAFEDNYLVNHGAMSAVTAPHHNQREIEGFGTTAARTVGESKHVLTRTIVVDGLVAGVWEVDPRARGAVWHAFDPPSRALAKQLDDRTHDLATFLLDELGHARSFSLDTMDDVQDRADRIARMRDGKRAATSKPKAIAAKAATKKQPAARPR